jgi:hypothetical protein
MIVRLMSVFLYICLAAARNARSEQNISESFELIGTNGFKTQRTTNPLSERLGEKLDKDLRVKRNDDAHNEGIDVNYSVSSDDEVNSTNESTIFTSGFNVLQVTNKSSNTTQISRTSFKLSTPKAVSASKRGSTSQSSSARRMPTVKTTMSPRFSAATQKSSSKATRISSVKPNTGSGKIVSSSIASSLSSSTMAKSKFSSSNIYTTSSFKKAAKSEISSPHTTKKNPPASSVKPATPKGKIESSKSLSSTTPRRLSSKSFSTAKTSSFRPKPSKHVKSFDSAAGLKDSSTSTGKPSTQTDTLKFAGNSLTSGTVSTKTINSLPSIRIESTTAAAFEMISNTKDDNQSSVKKKRVGFNAAQPQEKSQKFQFDTTTTQKIAASIHFPSK